MARPLFVSACSSRAPLLSVLTMPPTEPRADFRCPEGHVCELSVADGVQVAECPWWLGPEGCCGLLAERVAAPAGGRLRRREGAR